MKHSQGLTAACVGLGFLAGCGTGNGFAGSAPTSTVPLMDQRRSVPARSSHRPASAGQNLYVASGDDNTVTVYLHGSTSVLRTISQGVLGPHALTFDGATNLYVANTGDNSVTVYAPGTTSVLRTVTHSVRYPEALAFDANNDLFVGNDCSCAPTTVREYANGKRFVRTISKGVNEPQALSFDGSGNLYVANYFGNAVTVYAAAGMMLLRKISDGVNHPNAWAFYGSGNSLCCQRVW